MLVIHHLLKSIISLLLTIVLAIPIAVQISHAFANHEHTICKSNDIHFHEADLVDCSICDYNITTYHFNITAYPKICKYITIKNKPKVFIGRLKNKIKSNPKSLRGPPLFYFT